MNTQHSSEYLAVLASDRWKWLSRTSRASGICEVCQDRFSPDALQLHHLHYDNLGTEEIRRDVIVVCEDCHDLADRVRSSLKESIAKVPKRHPSFEEPWALYWLGIPVRVLRMLRDPSVEFAVEVWKRLQHEGAIKPPRPVKRSPPSVVPRNFQLPARSRYPGARLEQQMLKAILSGGCWLERAREEVKPEMFEVPTYREMFEALLALTPPFDPDAVLGQMTGRVHTSCHLLNRAAKEESAAGIIFDEVYAGALQGLRARDVSRFLAPVLPGSGREHQLKDLSSDQRARFIIRKVTGQVEPWKP